MGVGQDQQVVPSGYRAASGRLYEEFTPGDIYEHRSGRTVTQHAKTQMSSSAPFCARSLR